MAIHWQVPFCSLRANKLYTVNIYDASHSGSPVVLSGAEEPFVTEEDTDEDVFTPVRTHSGYIRIIDTGGLWQQIAPVTDTQRPVTLTDDNGNVCWQGFIQSQNFGTTLYGDPQECEFPVQCPLATAGSRDVFTLTDTVSEMKNFAFYLKRIIDYIVSASGNVISFDNVYVQGLLGADAGNQLLALVDPLVFADLDRDKNTIESKYTLYDVLEDMCRYWGWTARTFGCNIYLTAANPSSAAFTQITMTQLATYANGTAAGTSASFSPITIGDVFASTNNEITIHRGYSKATVKGDAGNADNEVIDCFPECVNKQIDATTAPQTEYIEEDYVAFSGSLDSIDAIDLKGSSDSYGSFRRGWFYKLGEFDAHAAEKSILFMPRRYNGTAILSLNTVYEHNYAGRYLSLNGTAYLVGRKMDYTSNNLDYGGQVMRVKLGIVNSRSSAIWFNGSSWTTTETYIDVTIGNGGTKMYVRTAGTGTMQYNYTYKIPVPNEDGFFGKLFIEFLGRETCDTVGTVDLYGINLADFNIKTGILAAGSVTQDASFDESTKEYVATNTNIVQEEVNVDCLFCSWGNVDYGYGILSQRNGTQYGWPQESLLAFRICGPTTGFWRISRRMYNTELLANDSGVAAITPAHDVTIASTPCIPISIGRSWRDDVAKILFIQK